MAEPFLLIDGYNLLHAAGLARRRYGPGGLERSRNRLLRLLCSHLTAKQLARTTIVFDAHDVPLAGSGQSTLNGMRVLFAHRNSDADELIEELIAAHSAPRQLRVVSSDHRLQKAARRRRGEPVDSETFFAELERRGPVAPEKEAPASPPPDPKTGSKPSDAETEYWLKEFGDVSDLDELRSYEQDLGAWQKEIDELSDDLSEIDKWLDDWLDEEDR